jgi:4-amino-4-deoxy-L-arabinose transferase-like glycosyltransferase
MLERFRPVLLILVVALFCLPLFIGLGVADLRGDEALYSYAVDRILESDEWLVPKASPSDYAFVEKPPLKFWIVAGAMRLQLLPHNEFGMRFWDALFGGLAFLYVFALGHRLAGPVCGVTAVLLLFVHWSLIFEHGLRTNNMEAALLLSYCGGFHHYFAWASPQSSHRRWHAVAVAVYFALGFMVKFVAALFLPLVLGVASLAIPAYRSRLISDWRIWSMAIFVALALITPWFAFAHYTFGADFWEVIFSQQIYTRLTAGLDPTHLHSTGYYLSELYRNLTVSHIWWLTAAGGVLFVVDTVRRRSAEGLVVLLWFVLPIAVMSVSSSKIYHYAYPILPPLALAGGYLLAFCWLHLQPLVSRFVSDTDKWDQDEVRPWTRRLLTIRRRPVLRLFFLAISTAAAAIIVWTLVVGPVRIVVDHTVVFKNGSVLRPWLIAVTFGVLAGHPRQAALLLGVPVLMLWMLPLPTYRDYLHRFRVETTHPMQSARDCIGFVRTATAPAWQTLYVAGPDSAFGHGHYYYFRPWEQTRAPADETLSKYLYDPEEQRPVLIAESWYESFKRGVAAGAIPSVPEGGASPGVLKLDDALLLLPGPYAVCDPTSDFARGPER